MCWLLIHFIYLINSQNMEHIERREMFTKFWSGRLKARDRSRAGCVWEESVRVGLKNR